MNIKDLSKPLEVKDIQCRIGNTSPTKGFTILLYKDARCDVRRLNSVCGLNWTNNFYRDEVGQLICRIGIWDGEKWIYREDVGVDSNNEKAKGSHSDAFKRAGFKWGIGAELYDKSLRFIWIKWSNWSEKVPNKKQFPKNAYLKNWKVKFLGENLLDGIEILDEKGKKQFPATNYKKNTEEKKEIEPSLTEELDNLQYGLNVPKKLTFNRNDLLGFGNYYAVKSWKEVDSDYLESLAKGDGIHNKKARAEIKIREKIKQQVPENINTETGLQEMEEFRIIKEGIVSGWKFTGTDTDEQRDADLQKIIGISYDMYLKTFSKHRGILKKYLENLKNRPY